MAVTDTVDIRATGAGLEHIPGDAGLPIVGSTLEFVRDPFGFHDRRRANHGPIYKFRVFGGWTVALNGADALEHVLMDKGRNFSSREGWRVLRQLFPNGLMLRDFDDHRQHRRVMQVAFKPAAMQDYVGRMNDGIARALDNWAATPEMRFYDAIKQLTLDLGASVFLGLDMGPEARRLNQAFVDEVAASIAVIRSPWPGTRMWRGVRARRFLLDYFRTLVPERRAGSADDMFSQLCRAESEDGSRYTDGEILDHMNFLLMAAHDTTTSALTTMVWALAQYPEWQDVLRREFRELGAERLDYGRMDAPAQTERVFKEALRLRPPVPFIPRVAVNSFSYGGFDIPAGCGVVVSPGLVARDAELWSAPETFDPDRFSPNRAEDQRHRFAWSPFGGGAHKCIGMHFAMMQVKAFACQFLQRFEVSLPDGYRPEWQAIPIPKPKDRLPIRLSRL